MSASQTDLAKARRALLEKRLQKAKKGTSRAIGPRPQGVPMPLSFAQQRLWFLSQLEPDNPAYNTFAVLHFKGQLDVAALGQSLDEIVRRHQVLQMLYVAAEEETVQMTPHPEPLLDLEIVDLSALPPSERESEVQRRIAQSARQPFDLARELPLRTTLWRLEQDEHVLLLMVHHIAIDGWSMSVFVKELRALYQAFREGEPSPLPEMPIQYADFAYWQRNWLQGEVLEKQIAYWERQLAGAPTSLELVTDHPRPSILSSNGALYNFRLSPSLSRDIKALSQQENATLFMTLLSAFQVLLHRYTGQENFLVGAPIAGRTRSEVENLIGFFVNTLVLRADLGGDPTARELLQRTRKTTLQAYEHQDIPFEKLVEELQPERSLSHNPLFQVMFMFHNLP
ncbi:MAG: condensation domain-containing protein, partial [Anaerolineae bacterium]